MALRPLKFLTSNLWIVGAFLLGSIWILRAPLAPDLDLYLHLKTGELIVNEGKLSETDRFTFMANDRPEEVHSWLSQVVLHVVYSRFGETGLRLFQIALLFALMAIVLSAVGSEYRPLTAILLLLLQSELIVLRPLLLGQIGFALVALHLLPRMSLWTPVAIGVWGNLHGSVLIALPLLLFWGLSLGRERKLSRQPIGVLLASGLAVFCNPSHLNLLFQAGELASLGRIAGIWEWQGRRPFFIEHSNPFESMLRISFSFVDILLCAGLVAAVATWRKAPAITLLAIGFLLLPLFAGRHIVFLLFPMVQLVERLPVPRVRSVHFLVPLLLMATAWQSTLDPSIELKQAVSRLKVTGYRGPILNFPGWGSYLIFAGYPEWRVLADRRLSVNRDYYLWESDMVRRFGGINVEEIVTRFPNVKVALFHTDGFGRGLKDKGWRPVYEGKEVSLWMLLPNATREVARGEP